MGEIEVLSANAGKWQSKYVGCSPVRWNGVMSAYSLAVRGHCANLAAHSHDVLLIDGRLFVGHAQWNTQQPMFGDWFDPSKDYNERLKAARGETPEELAELYDGEQRKFPLPA